MNESTRRQFLKTTAAVAGAAGVVASVGSAKASAPRGEYGRNAVPLEKVRVGLVGIGWMGNSHLKELTKIPNAEITAVCDISAYKAGYASWYLQTHGRPAPATYSNGETDFENLCARDDVDLVLNATPWNWHVPICLAAMNNGKHAATEVPAALTVSDCWRLVDKAEETGLYCIMMENCCYGRAELMVLNMVRQGLLGELVHAECGYMHDLRTIKFHEEGEGLWRWQYSITMNGNLYPTHGLGPVSQCMNINRGDRFNHLVSMSSPPYGLNDYIEEVLPEDDPRGAYRYMQGDVNSSMIQTRRGRTIILQHDTNLPRPYSRINLVQGTKGLFSGYPDRLYIEGRSPDHEWQDAADYFAEFDHPLYTATAEAAAGAGHDGMDFVEDHRLIECLVNGEPPDMDVYDAAAWSCIVELSRQSVARKGGPVAFPDFTRGQWKTRSPLPIIYG